MALAPTTMQPTVGQVLPNSAPLPGAPPVAANNAPPSEQQPQLGIWGSPSQPSFQMLTSQLANRPMTGQGQMPGQPLPHLPIQPPGSGGVDTGQRQPTLPGMPTQPSPLNPQMSAQQTPTGILPGVR